MRTTADLHTKRNKLLADATELLNRGLSTPEIRASYKKILSQADEVQSDIDVLSRIERAMPSLIAVPASKPAPVIEVVPESPEKRRAKQNIAARSFLKHGWAPNTHPEQRDLTGASDAAGGAVVAQAFSDAMIEATKYYGNIFNMVNRKDAETGQPTKFVVNDSTAQTFSLVTSGSTSGSGIAQQPTIFSDIVNVDSLLSSNIFSLQELEDSAFDLTAFLIKQMGTAFSRAAEQAITNAITNDGTSTALPSSPSGGLLAAVSTGVTQGSGTLAAGVTLAQLNSLAASVDRSYFETGSYVASPSVEASLRALVDTTGRSLIPIDPETGLLNIQGKLLYPNAAMPAAGTASSKLVLFGDYSKAYSVLNAGIRFRVIADEESPALVFNTRELLCYFRIGATTGLSSSVAALVSAAS